MVIFHSYVKLPEGKAHWENPSLKERLTKTWRIVAHYIHVSAYGLSMKHWCFEAEHLDGLTLKNPLAESRRMMA